MIIHSEEAFFVVYLNKPEYSVADFSVFKQRIYQLLVDLKLSESVLVEYYPADLNAYVTRLTVASLSDDSKNNLIEMVVANLDDLRKAG